MTEEQRKQAAAQRCRELYKAKFGDAATSFIDPDDNAWVDTVLQLDELARKYRDSHNSFGVSIGENPYDKHILPEPKPSLVELVAKDLGVPPGSLAERLATFGCKLVEVDPSDDQ